MAILLSAPILAGVENDGFQSGLTQCHHDYQWQAVASTPGAAQGILRYLGINQTYPHMAIPWTWAFSTPFSWTKLIASHFGGTRQGMAISWPESIKDKGGIRWQFHHVIDVVPTILEAPRPNLTAGRNVFSYAGELTGTPNGDAPNLLGASYNIRAEVVIPAGGAEGVMVTHGGRFGGYGFYLLNNKPVFTCNMLGLERVKWAGKDALSPGKHTLEYDFKYDGLGVATLAFNSVSGLGRSGTGVLKVDAVEVASIKLPKTIPLTLQWDENFDVGADTLTGVDDKDYQPPFKFTGELSRLTITIDRPKLSKADISKLEQAMHKNPASE